jgi:putative transposase
MVFVEARWFYNHIISLDDPFNGPKLKDIKETQVKVLNKFEKRTFKLLSTKMKAELRNRIQDAIKALSSLKKKNFKVGRLKFKPQIDSVEFTKIRVKNRMVKADLCKKPFKVHGFDQIPKGVEFANGTLERKASGYYFHVTTFQTKISKEKTGKEVGIDMGIKNTVTTSDGETFKVEVKESEKLKRLQRHFSRKKKGSKNRFKVLKKIKKEYEKLSNQKRDKANKIVSHLKNSYDKIYIQDENLKGWHKGIFGKAVQTSALGAIKARLKNLESTQMISRFEPTTKLCYCCGKENSIKLSQRIYKCECGLEEDRDIKAAKTILLIGQSKINSVRVSNGTPEEKKISTGNSFEFLANHVSLSQAATLEIAL